MRTHTANHLLHLHVRLHAHVPTLLATALIVLLGLAACRVEGHYEALDAGDAYVPIDDWVLRLGGPDFESIGNGTTIAAAPNGDLVLVGSFRGTTNLGGAPLTAADDVPLPLPSDDVWVARYRPDGSHVWSIRLGGNYGDSANAVAVDDAGDVYVAGGFTGPVDFGGGERTSGGGFVLKLAGETGAYTWDRTFRDPTSSLFGTGLGLAAVGTDTIVLSGMFAGTMALDADHLTSMPPDGNDCFLAALDTATGRYRWARALNSTGNENAVFYELPDRCNVIGVGSDVIVGGTFLGIARLGGGSLTSLGAGDVFIARFRGSDGSHVWSRRHGGPSQEAAYALATDGTRIFVGGWFSDTASFGQTELTAIGIQDAFLASYNAEDGSSLWSRRFGGTSLDHSREETISITGSPGQLAITIGFEEDLTVGEQHFKTEHDSGTLNKDVAVVRLDPAGGQPFDAWHVASPGTDRIVVTLVGRALAGSSAFAGMTYLFGKSLTSLGNYDIAAFRIELDRGKALATPAGGATPSP
jgi:hypothetical protein